MNRKRRYQYLHSRNFASTFKILLFPFGSFLTQLYDLRFIYLRLRCLHVDLSGQGLHKRHFMNSSNNIIRQQVNRTSPLCLVSVMVSMTNKNVINEYQQEELGPIMQSQSTHKCMETVDQRHDKRTVGQVRLSVRLM